MVVVGLLSFILLIVPYINPYRSTKGLAAKLDTLLPPGEKLTFVHRLQDSALFYTDRKATILRRPKDIRDYLASDERVFCVIRKRYFDILESYPCIAVAVNKPDSGPDDIVYDLTLDAARIVRRSADDVQASGVAA